MNMSTASTFEIHSSVCIMNRTRRTQRISWFQNDFTKVGNSVLKPLTDKICLKELVN